MKGNIVKRDKGDWVIWYVDLTSENGIRILPLSGEGYESGSEVEFEIIDNQAFIKHGLSQETLEELFAAHDPEDFIDEDDVSDWDITLLDGLDDE